MNEQKRKMPIWLRAIGILLVVFGIIALFMTTFGGLFDVESQSDMLKTDNWLPIVISIAVLMLGAFLSGKDIDQAKRWFLVSICWGVSVLLSIFSVGFDLGEKEGILTPIFLCLGLALIIYGFFLLFRIRFKGLLRKILPENTLNESKEETFEHDTGKCPYCNSSNIDEGWSYSWQRRCLDCKKQWNIQHK